MFSRLPNLRIHDLFLSRKMFYFLLLIKGAVFVKKKSKKHFYLTRKILHDFKRKQEKFREKN